MQRYCDRRWQDDHRSRQRVEREIAANERRELTRRAWLRKRFDHLAELVFACPCVVDRIWHFLARDGTYKDLVSLSRVSKFWNYEYHRLRELRKPGFDIDPLERVFDFSFGKNQPPNGKHELLLRMAKLWSPSQWQAIHRVAFGCDSVPENLIDFCDAVRGFPDK
jgi:hypothetical protein